MVMVAVVVFTHQFETARAVAKIKSFDHSHLFQQMHGTINGGQIAPSIAFLHLRQKFPIGQWMGMFPQDFQYGRPRAGDFSGLAAQTAFED